MLKKSSTFAATNQNIRYMEIKFDKKNYRKHSEQNKERIRKSLAECGAGRSVLVDADDTLVAGNGVFEQAKAMGIPTRVIETDGTELVVVKRTDLRTDDDKRKLLSMADNATSDNVEWDMETLQDDFDVEDLADWDIHIAETLSEDELDGLFDAEQEHEKTKDLIKIQIPRSIFNLKIEIEERIKTILEDYDGAKII